MNAAQGTRFERASALLTMVLALTCGGVLVLGASDLDRRTARQREQLARLRACEREAGEPGHVVACDGLFPGLQVHRVVGDAGLTLRLVPAPSPGGQP